MSDRILKRGDTLRFTSGLTVALTETFNSGSTWRVLVLHPVDDLSTGDMTYMSWVTLDQGELLDWEEVERSLDHLHEIYSVADRDLIAEVTE